MSESVSTKGEANKDADSNAPEVKVRRSVWLNFYLMAILLHVPVFFYPILRLAHWLDLNSLTTLLILVPLTGSQILSRVFLRDRTQVWAKLLCRASDFWLGMSALVLSALVVFEILVFADLVSGRNAAISVISISSMVALLGTLNALTPSVVVVKFKAPELKSPVRFVQISDVH